MTSDWYRPSSHDRSTVGQRKLDELQRQIITMESEMKEQSDLMHKLNRLQTIENEKRDLDEKVLERNSRSNTPRVLHSEMERLYGRDSRNLNDRNRSPAMDKKTINSVIQQRTKEFSQKQQETAMKTKYLEKERLRLQDARRRVEEQRQALLNSSSPTGKSPYFFHNDKLYMPYEPYRFPEDIAERVRDSFVLPIPKPIHVGKNYKLKVKFLPVPIEEASTWTKYHNQILEEEDDEVDEAVLAFQSLTSKKLREHKSKKFKYMPVYAPEAQNIERSLSENTGNYRHRKYHKMEGKFGGTVSADKFQESLQFGAIHDGYRGMDDRVNQQGSKARDNKRGVNLNDARNRKSLHVNHSGNIYHNDSQYYKNLSNSQETITNQPRKVKVRFRATPAYDDHLDYNKHYRT